MKRLTIIYLKDELIISKKNESISLLIDKYGDKYVTSHLLYSTVEAISFLLSDEFGYEIDHDSQEKIKSFLNSDAVEYIRLKDILIHK